MYMDCSLQNSGSKLVLGATTSCYMSFIICVRSLSVSSAVTDLQLVSLDRRILFLSFHFLLESECYDNHILYLLTSMMMLKKRKLLRILVGTYVPSR